jgi:hypothetical protein
MSGGGCAMMRRFHFLRSLEWFGEELGFDMMGERNGVALV